MVQIERTIGIRFSSLSLLMSALPRPLSNVTSDEGEVLVAASLRLPWGGADSLTKFSNPFEGHGYGGRTGRFHIISYYVHNYLLST